MQFRLLGNVEVEVAGEILPLPRRRVRCLLAVLLLDLGRVVPMDRLTELLWDGDPPGQARRTLHGHVSRLRTALATGGEHRGVVVATIGDGYRIEADPQAVDAHRFQALVSQAATTADPARRIDRLRSALDLWRGPALGNAASEWLRRRLCASMDEQRLAATEDLVSASLALRREREILPELAQAANAHPGRESLTALYMRALYQAGRKTDALDAYTRARTYLADELGLDPGPDLGELHQAILRDQLAMPSATEGTTNQVATAAAPETQAAGPSTTRKSGQLVVPRQLPAPPPVFTGRAGELAELDRVHDRATVVITAIDGMAGIGKTALALHAAHRFVDRYPEGQLFIDLHGYAPGLRPVEPGEALERMLRALGVAGEQIPAGLDERAALYRSRLADQQLLIVLDNAATEAQVSPLLPGTPGCLVLVTSRHRLTGLDHTHTVSLDTLPLPDAVTLFVRTVGEQRLATERLEVLAEIAQSCGRLPLAIRIAAARLRSHPTWTVAHLVERLRDHEHRLAELAAGQRSVTAALDLSYQQLTTDQQHMYRLLALQPGPDLDSYAAAALADLPVVQAGQLLDQLLDAHLLQEPTPGRYVLHDLVGAHAAHAAAPADAEPDRRAALTRLFDHYRYTTSVAMDTAYPYERERRPRIPPAATPVPDIPDPAPATAWLDIELPNLLATARHAASHGMPAHTLDLSAVLHWHLRIGGRYRDAEVLHHHALTTARITGHRAGEMDALSCLGDVHRLQGHYEQAVDDFGQALEIARTSGHRAGELNALRGLGWIHLLQGRHEQALDHYQQVIDTARTTGDRAGALDALFGLGEVHRSQGRYKHAIDHYRQALEIARTTGHRTGELNALRGLGHAHRLQGRYQQAIDDFGQALEIARTTGHRASELGALNGLGHGHVLQGRYQQAIDHYRQALEIARTTGHRTGKLNALLGLGHVHRLQGRHEQALDHYQQVIDIARETGDHNGQFEAIHGLGRLHHAIGHSETALVHHRQALGLATDLGQLADQTRAHDGLAHAYHALNQPGQARHHWQHAVDLLTSLGTDHTEEEEASTPTIRAHLANLDQPQTPPGAAEPVPEETSI